MKKIAVFTSGGDAPGMNACVRAVVRCAAYNGVEVIGIEDGYEGMINKRFRKLKTESVANIIQQGGTMLRTSRSERFRTEEGRKQAYTNLVAEGIEGIICIGGDGTFTGAEIFYKEYKIPSIGVPGTIDNDIYGTDYTIGFDTAVNTAVEAIDKIRDTAESHNRVFFIEVMGRNTGFLALEVGIAGGAEAVLIPETATDINELIKRFKDKTRRRKSYSIVVVAEGDEEGGAFEIAAKLKAQLPYFDPRVTVLGHIQRGGRPTALDRVLASRLGATAVEQLMKGEKNKAVGLINNKVVLTDYKDAITKKKAVNQQLVKLSEVLVV